MPLHHIPYTATGEAPDASPRASGAAPSIFLAIAEEAERIRLESHALWRAVAIRAAHATVAQDGAR